MGPAEFPAVRVVRSPGDRGAGGRQLGRGLTLSSPGRFMLCLRMTGCVLRTLQYFIAGISGLGRLLVLEVRRKVRRYRALLRPRYLIISVQCLASGQLLHPPGLMVGMMMMMMMVLVVGVVVGRGQHLGAHAVLG